MVKLKNTSREQHKAAMEMEKVQCMSGGEVETASGSQSKLHTADIPVERVFHMNGGEGDNSYSNNSLTQKKVILETKAILEESIVELYSNSFPECINVADLGCSSGPNTFLPTWQIIEVLDTKCRGLNLKPPMLQLFLNDLPGNDFNTVFRSLLPSFCERLEKEKGNEFCFVAAVPGSFYGRLFPPHSLHFIYSSYSLHWLSQVPVGLVSELGLPLNKGNIYIAKTSPPSVHKAYSDQYEKDFTTFLKLRSKEMIPGGRMVLTFKSSDEDDESYDQYGPDVWELLGIVLHDMVLEGLIEESKLDSFNMPHYAPYVDEVRQVIQMEGSFTINRVKIIQLSWDANIDDGKKDLVLDNYAKGKFVADRMRAIGEPILASHFGDAIMDDLFQRYCIKAMGYIEMGKGVLRTLIISMTKK